MAAYFIVDQCEVSDAETTKTYAAGVADTIRQHGGRLIVRGGPFEVKEGDYQPHRIIILEFPDMAALKGWYDGPAYADLKAMRLRSSKSNAVMVEGV